MRKQHEIRQKIQQDNAKKNSKANNINIENVKAINRNVFHPFH